MPRFPSGSFALSLLPVIAALGLLSLGTTTRPGAAPTEAETLVVYQAPSWTTDRVHVTQLHCILQTIRTYRSRAEEAHLRCPSHAALAAEYRVIVRETTPESLRRAGLPFDVR